MTRDDVIRMAREAGGHEMMRIDGAQDSVVGITGNDALVRFAAIVAAHEREECAKVADDEASLWSEFSDGRVSLSGVAASIRARR